MYIKSLKNSSNIKYKTTSTVKDAQGLKLTFSGRRLELATEKIFLVARWKSVNELFPSQRNTKVNVKFFKMFLVKMLLHTIHTYV